ncbi:D-alanyl-D-alanine carboxypeptidase/D-alanyl-D-alanine-endopeptidase [Tannerella sp. AF04-6]|nr:D-alanyl-D-alanine carboxypeptidase/D-alanyl-D-alanine-endopeptidase [Tannerella sp. AF04-6]
MSAIIKLKYIIVFLWSGLFYFSYAGMGISRFVSLPELRSASVGFCIMDIETGEIVSSYDSQRLLLPASALKLLTSATVLGIYGGEHRFYTDVQYSGYIGKDGVLYGDLYIQGCGDPTLGSEYGTRRVFDFRNRLLKELENAGIHRIEGCIIADDSRFDTEGVSPKWLWEDVGNYFAAGCYGINYRDNTYRLILRSGAKGSTPVIIGVEPEISGLSFSNHLVSSSNAIDSAYIYGAPFSLRRYIYGSIPEKQDRFVIKGDLPDPALFFANEMASFLKASRIKVTGTPVTMRILNENNKTKPLSDRSMLFRYSSDRLSDIIRIVNHNSNNLYAEALLRWIALSRYPEASASKGIEVLKHFWKEKGVFGDDLVMYDGSGLSPVNRISAEMLCRVLDFMASDKNLQTIFYSSLPCPGVSGTVRSFLKNSSLSKRMRLKSGSMAHVQSYAGYYDSGNKRYAVAIIVNNFSGSRSYLRRVLEQMFEDELKSL